MLPLIDCCIIACTAVADCLKKALCVCSTMFLVGPIKQLAAMFEKGRVVATLVYIAAMFLTLFSAIKVCACPCLEA